MRARRIGLPALHSTLTVLISAFLLGAHVQAQAAHEPSALVQASQAYEKLDDYRMTIAVHETAGAKSEDVVYAVLFMKPAFERVDVVAGPGAGGGLVWIGGPTVKAHHGGFLHGIHLTLDLHSKAVATLRGESADQTTVPAMLAHFTMTKGTLVETPGPTIAGVTTVQVTLDVADPASDAGLTREMLYLANTTHFPMRWECYIGPDLVKRMNVTAVQTNVGLTAADFPW